MTDNTRAGAAIYLPVTLRFYDLVVHGFSNAYAWRCPENEFIKIYDQNVSANHLDVGCGTGYLLDHCRFPVTTPHVTLADLNPNSLKWSSQRIQRYSPKSYVADVLKPLPMTEQFNSIGLNYVLHCVPGNFRAKGIAFDHLKDRLSPGGVLFGSTIPCIGVNHNLAARVLMTIYGWIGAFNNKDDSVDDLTFELSRRFTQVKVWTIGSVALFTARNST